MTSDQSKNALRLLKRHEPDPEPPPDPAIGQRLLEVQSLRNALIASVIAICVFTSLWVMVSSLMDRIFPWATVLLGFLVGFAVRRAGLGLTWPFPLVAALATVVGSLAGGLVVAAALVAQDLRINLFAVLGELTSSWSAFVAEALTPADVVFAIAAAGIAAFFSTRRLSRRQYLALRLWKESKNPGRDQQIH